MFKFLKAVLFYEIIVIKEKLSFFHYFFTNISIVNFFLFLTDRIKYNPFKQSEFINFIYQNKRKWFSHKKIYNNKFILVESFINHPAYTLSNAASAFMLSKAKNLEILGLVRKNDFKSELILRSFGCKKIIFYNRPNFFYRLWYLIKSIKIIGNKKKLDELTKIKINGVDIGLIAYDTYIRYKYNPSLQFVNSHYLIYFAQAIYSQNFIDKIIKEKKIKILVQSETQYVPLSIFFQSCLKNNIQIFTRSGLESFTLRHYKNWNQRYLYRATVSQRLFDFVNKNYKKNAINMIKKIYNKKLKNNSFGVDDVILGLGNNNYKSLKQEIKNRKKNVIFYLSHLLDGNFVYGPRKHFKDVYTGTKFIINQLPKLNKVNWYIKKHPNHDYLRSNFDFTDILKDYQKKYKNITLLDDKISPTSLLNMADVGLTLSGTVGVEYPALGKQCIFIENTYYSNLEFFKKIDTKKNLLKTLKNLHKSKKPSKKLIEKCLIYLFIKDVLLRNRCYLIPEYIPSRKLDEKFFWKKASKNLKKFSFEKDEFYRMLIKQLELKLRHTINFKRIKKTKKIFNDFNEIR